MGCEPPVKPQKGERTDSLVGVLNITVASISFQEKQVIENGFLNVRVSNQQFNTKSKIDGSNTSLLNEKFSFIINSFFKSKGRTVEVELWSDGIQGLRRTELAYGSVDIDPIINANGSIREFRCIINHSQKQFAVVNLVAQFEEKPSTKISLRFQTATLRRKTSIIGDVEAFIRVTIGEEVLETNKSKDLPETPPIWKDQILGFQVPNILEKGYVEVFDEELLIGALTLDLKKILKTSQGEEIFLAEELFYNDHDAGTLKYSYLTGSKADFSVVHDPIRSSIRINRTKEQR